MNDFSANNAQLQNPIEAFRSIVGDANVMTDEKKFAAHTKGFRYGSGSAMAVAKPGSLVEMWRLLQYCIEHDVVIIFQAANTGLTGGSTPYGKDYDRPVLIISTLRLHQIQLLNNAEQVIGFPGSTLFDLERKIKPFNREPHSVIGSSSVGASIIGGVCNNSGGSLVHRGPAYTELALFAQVNAEGKLELKNHLGILLGEEPEDILTRLENGDYTEEDIQYPDKKASDDGYVSIVRNVDADTPARYNADTRLLHEASGSAGKLAVFAVRLDTFPMSEKQKVFYIGTNDINALTQLRRDILKHFKTLPVAGEYLHRDYYIASQKYGKDNFIVINKLGSDKMPMLFSLKSRADAFFSKVPFAPKYLTDKVMQGLSKLFPEHLPQRMNAYRDRFEHHLMLKVYESGVEETQTYLETHFRDNDGEFFFCTDEEAEKAYLHRFVAAGAAKRLQMMTHKNNAGILALDIALRRNDPQWLEVLPPDVEDMIEAKLYCGHFFCHVLHQDYIVKKGVDPFALKARLLELLDERNAEYPSEHNVGQLYTAKPDLRAFYQALDPTNAFNPGIGKTSRNKHWA
ncbi:MAG TPA: D-lactate dehydrogenase [Gammaproteobacteria bacterium]|jgi:D-lactate dehydrogenase|nr:D-lactate dehydrogenase [Gammaproteobacteria bacterium]